MFPVILMYQIVLYQTSLKILLIFIEDSLCVNTVLGPSDIALNKIKIPYAHKAYVIFKFMVLFTFWSTKNEFIKVEIRSQFLKSL